MARADKNDQDDLRRRAEELVSNEAVEHEGRDERSARELLRELRVQRTELELRNDELRESQEHVRHLNRVLLAIRNVNQLITHERDPQRLIREGCRLLTDTRGFYNAWIALTDGESGAVTTTASAGFDGGFAPMRTRLERSELPSCTRRALEGDGLIVTANPPSDCPDCPLSGAYGGRAGLTHRLAFEGRPYGVLSVSVPAPLATHNEEHELFVEVANDIGFALYRIETERRVRHLGRIVTTIQQPMALISADYRYLTVNDAYGDIFGVPHARIPGHTAEKFVGRDIFLSEVKPRLDRSLKGEEVHYEIELRLPGHGVRWIAASYFPYRDESGRITGVVSHGLDITDRKRAEEGTRAIAQVQGELLRAETPEEICGVVTGAVHRTLGGGVVLSALAGAERSAAQVVSYDGLTVPVERVVAAAGFDPMRKPVSFARMTRTELKQYRSGRLELLEEGVRALSGRRISPAACDGVASLLGGSKVYVAGFVLGGRHHGGIAILTNDDISAQASLIETIVHQAALAIHRMTVERERREVEGKFRQIFDGSRDGFVMVDTAGRIIDCNAAFCAMLGYSAAELRALGSFDDITPSAWHEWERTEIWERRLLGQGYSGVYEKEYVRKDGTVFAVELQSYAVRDEQGDIDYLWGVARDISARKEAENALRDSEYQKGLILDATVEMFACYDLDLRILWANRAAGDSIGVPAAELVGRHCYAVWHGRNEPCENCPVLRARDEKCAQQAEQTTPDGRRWFLRGYPVLDAQGEVEALVEFGQDITTRKEAEERLAAEREQLAVTLRSIGDGVITTDTEGRVVIINKAAEDLTGWTQQEAAGLPLSEVFAIVNEFTRKPCANPVEKVLSSGEIVELANHTMLLGRDGAERIIADSGAPIRNVSGETVGVVLVFRDVTEKQKLIENMQRTDKLDSLGVLAGGIAHDFNNLLGGLFGFLSLARESSEGNRVVSGYLDRSLAVFNRARDLTQQLLTFSKGGAPLRKTGDFGPLVRESVSFALAGSNVACDYELPNDLWACAYDENQMGQVIDNIALNAQQAMPMGGRIAVSAENVELADGAVGSLRAGRYVRVSIGDQGVGMPPEILKRIFDPFFTTKQKGNGLGLATCYSIVQKHDGHIEVESTPGKGTTFHVYLPASGAQADERAEASPAVLQGSGTIVVMDDEDFIRDVAAQMLETIGFDVLQARDGDEALRMCAQAIEEGRELRAAIFDLTVPGGLGGREALQRMREKYADIPVFASSGYSEDPVIARPVEFGFTDSIRKPYHKDELVALLAKSLGGET